MEVTVHPRQFVERLRLAAALVGRRNPSPVLETVQLDVRSSQDAWLRASDGQADLALAVPVLKVAQPGKAQLPWNPTLAARGGACVTIRERPAASAAADEKTPSRQVVLDLPRGALVLASFDPDLFPAQVVEDPKHAVQLTAWRFARLIHRTQFAADDWATRWALGGCLLEFAGDRLQAVSTDGRAIAQATEPANGTGLRAPATTVVGDEERPLAPVLMQRPARALAAVLALAENAVLEVAFLPPGRFQARTTQLCLTARLPEGRFPPWQEVFPESATVGLRVDDPPRLLKTLKQILRLAGRGSRLTRLRLAGNTLGVALEGDQTRARFELPVRCLQPDISGASPVIDPRYLVAYLENSGEPFSMWFPPEPGTPLVCQGEGHRYALMPMDQAEGRKEATEQPPCRPAAEPPAEEVPVSSRS